MDVYFQPEYFLVAESKGELIGTIMAGYEGHHGWINYLAVDPIYQKQGIGKQLINSAETRLRALGCPKINLQVRSSNKEMISFYKKCGFILDDVLSLGKRL